jgi:hypothetical protein
MDSPELTAIKKLTLQNARFVAFFGLQLVEIRTLIGVLAAFERNRSIQAGNFDPAEFDKKITALADALRTEIKKEVTDHLQRLGLEPDVEILSSIQ